MEKSEKNLKLVQAKLHFAEIQLRQKDSELEKALTKSAEQQTQITLLFADLENAKVQL